MLLRPVLMTTTLIATATAHEHFSVLKLRCPSVRCRRRANGRAPFIWSNLPCKRAEKLYLKPNPSVKKRRRKNCGGSSKIHWLCSNQCRTLLKLPLSQYTGAFQKSVTRFGRSCLHLSRDTTPFVQLLIVKTSKIVYI